MKTNSEEFFARTGKTIGEAGRDKRAENIAGRRDYRALERRHDGAVRARDEALGKYADETDRVRNIRSAHIVPCRTEQAREMMLRPFMEGTRAQGTHVQYALHPHVVGKVEDMYEAPNPERIYDFFRQNGNGPRCIATFHLLLLSLLRCLLLLLILLFMYPIHLCFPYFLVIDLLECFSGFWAFKKK